MTRLSFIVTIDPVKQLDYLDVLIKSLNLQTRSSFDVIFYNQRRQRWADIVDHLRVQPRFPHRVVEVDLDRFIGSYPLWDLYRVHSDLLERDEVGDYLMALHMEEFLDVDYVDQAIEVLEANRFDILFGNLTRANVSYADLSPLLTCGDSEAFDRHLTQAGLKHGVHWAFQQGSLRPALLGRRLRNALFFRARPRVRATRRGYWKAGRYVAEDVFMMSKTFARRYNWFLSGHDMFFEDIHICEQRGVCELAQHLEKITPFPVYFDRRRVYHLTHGRYYFQIENEEFADGILALTADDPVLISLKRAILLYREGKLTLREAIVYSRRNPEREGSQDVNYRYHRLCLP